MKKIGRRVLILLLISIFMACSNDFEFETNDCDNGELSQSEEIILGLKRDNPFSISNARIASSDMEENYIYFRIRTNNLDNVEQIESVLGELNTIPLDYEVIEGGCVYNANLGSEDFSPWFYSMTTISDYEKVKELGEIEIIDKMYISEEDLAKFTEIDENEDLGARLLWVKYTKARPTGYVYFYDEVKKCNVPLKGVKVTVSQWCHVKSVYTNDEGFYDIGENFTSCWQNTANVKITFETKKDSVYPAWSVVKASYNAGDKSISALSSNNIQLVKDTKQSLYGVLLNAATMYRKYADELNITPPKDLKFWACTHINGGITLMRDVVVADAAAVGAAIGTGICPGVGTIIGTVAGAGAGTYCPDIMISLNSSFASKSESITECVFHEMAHASHFTGIGLGNVTYWNEEYIKMLGGWINVFANGSSPMENCYNDGRSKQVCFIESWGYFMGFYLTQKYYDGYKTYKDYRYSLSVERKDLPFLYYSVYNSILNNMTLSQIFSPYKYFGVKSIESWYDKLKSLEVTFDSDKSIRKLLEQRGLL